MKKIILYLMLVIGVVFTSGCKNTKTIQKADNPMYSNGKLVYNYVDGKSETKDYKLALQDDGAWRVRLSKEDLNSIKGLKSVDILLPASYAKKGEEGYFINTLSMMGTYKLYNSSYSSNVRNHVAFFGMKNPRATWVTIIKGLPLEFSMVAEAKDGKYKVFPRFEIEKMEGMPVYEDAIADFYPLCNKATYVDMAKVYRKYQVDRGEIKPLKERIKTDKKLERLAKSIMCRIPFGSKPIPKDKKGRWIPRDYTPETELPMTLHCTFDQAKESVELLKKYGCDFVDLQLVGWNIRGHDGRYPQLLPVEPAAGGEEKLKQLTARAKELGYNISAHTNHTDVYKVADSFDESYVAKRKDGSLMYVGCWAGGKAYTPCPKAIFELYPKKDYPMIRDRLGFNGKHHVDVISAIAPRICHDPNHKLNRKEWAEAYLKIMKYAHDVTGGFTSECGFDHVIKYLDWAFYINHSMHLPKIFDRHLPIWQIVYHGYVPSEAFFSDTGNNLRKDWQTIRLHHAEFGARPVYYGGWLGEHKIKTYVKPLYDEYQKVSHLQLEFMEDHKQIADNVYLTVYSNGQEVVTNYSDITIEYKGKPVYAKDYRLF
ncbi:MAG: hypothetical protein E7035_04685 [Verrucomicrobiaceae bacterium]|nr:hypothetical protein [Verrucomicrobiaceae bacterium]